MNDLKRCIKCNESKDSKFFHKGYKSKDGLCPYCKPCRRAVRGAKEKVFVPLTEEIKVKRKRNIYYKNRYGITIDEYNQMFYDQQGKCKICETHQSALKRKLAVDHCHSTGNIRGLLCNPCNIGIGMLRESAAILQAAIAYLTEG